MGDRQPGWSPYRTSWPKLRTAVAHGAKVGVKMVASGSLVAVWWRDKGDRAQGADSIVTGSTSKICVLFVR